MRHRLVGASDAGICVLFDRALTAEADLSGFDAFVRWLDAEVTRGGFFRYDLGGEGECAIDCFVEEAPPEDLRKRFYRGTEQLLLSIPSGQLCLAGAETIPRGDDGSWSCAAIPSGDYAVRAWLVASPDDEPVEPPRGASRYVPCVLFLVFLITGLVGLYLQSLVFAAVVVGAVVTAVAASLLWYNLSGKREQEESKHVRQLEEGPPDAVIQMTRVTDTAGMVGGRLSV